MVNGSKSLREDDVFGTLNYELMWKKKEQYTLYNKEYEIVLFIEGEETDLFTDSQRQAYVAFNNKKAILATEIEESIFMFYQSICEEYRAMYEEDADNYAPLICDRGQLKGFVKPQSIVIPRTNDKREINILFKTKWDLEMGIGIRLIDEKIELVGVQSDVL